MTKQGHQLISIGVTLVTAAAVFAVTQTWYLAAASCLLVVWGGTAPDWLEIAKWKNGERTSMIPHRTLTHWVVLWAGGSAWCIYILYDGVYSSVLSMLTSVLFGFLMGGLSHVLCDWLTPMGIPISTPFSRSSLYIVHGTALEIPIAIVSLCIGGVTLWASIMYYYS